MDDISSTRTLEAENYRSAIHQCVKIARKLLPLGIDLTK